MEQLQFDFESIGSITITPIEKIKFPRPEHKPYEPNYPSLIDGRGDHLFAKHGALLNWYSLHGAFSSFLSQRSTDPKLQKARNWRWEGKTIKVPAYIFREFEPLHAIHNAFCPLYEKYFKGMTTNINHHDENIVDEIMRGDEWYYQRQKRIEREMKND